MNPLMVEVIIQEKQRDMLQEAEHQRLVTSYNSNNPDRRARCEVVLGDFLIRFGEKIKHRYNRLIDMKNDLCRE